MQSRNCSCIATNVQGRRRLPIYPLTC
jgi:hypothetical protein